jgi:hypothetical protein
MEQQKHANSNQDQRAHHPGSGIVMIVHAQRTCDF